VTFPPTVDADGSPVVAIALGVLFGIGSVTHLVTAGRERRRRRLGLPAEPVILYGAFSARHPTLGTVLGLGFGVVAFASVLSGIVGLLI